MTIEQFNDLDELEQYEVFTSKGDAVAFRKDINFSYSLYQVDAFYMETKNNLGTGALQGARALENNSPVLELYLDRIEVGL